MIGPMLLGYLVGAMGVYGILYRFAPVGAEDARTHAAPTEVLHLFGEPTETEAKRAA